MSKKVKRILLAVLACVLVLGAGYVVLAENSNPTIRYNGDDGSFEVVANRYMPNWQPDLFTDLKDMMPGDEKVQQIDVTVRNLSAKSVSIYAVPIIPSDDRLGGLHNAYDELSEEIELYIANPTQVEYLLNLRNRAKNVENEKVLIATFTANGTKTIDLGLAISEWAGNDLADIMAVVDWKFIAEEVPYTPDPPSPPDPGPGGGDEPYVPSLETDKHINYIIGYDDGLVHPEGNLTRAETAAIFYRLLTDEALVDMWSTEPCYPDVPETAWYFMYVATLTNGDILTGYPDGTFLPDQPITRAEFATIVARFDTRFGELETTHTFPDIDGHWAQKYIEFAAECGYVHGYPDGTFLPDQYINRAEAVTLINHCLERHVDAQGLEDVTDYINWPDNADPEIWYYHEIIEAANYHDSNRSGRTAEGLVFKTENWTKLYEPIDWEKIEQEWIQYLTGNKDFVTDS